MLDIKGTLIVIGLIVLAAVTLMILVRPNPVRTRYRRVGLGQTGRARRAEPVPQNPRTPEAEPAETPARRKAESA